MRQCDVAVMHPVIDEACLEGLKFSDCLPPDLATKMLERRLQDQQSTRTVLAEAVRMCEG